MKLAFVHDWLSTYTGAEKVLEDAMALYPGSPLYTLIYQAENFRGSALSSRTVHTSLIERLPGGRRKYRSYLPFMPYAVEQFDLSEYDVVISSSTAVAKGVLTRADQLHISYVNTPVRYAWDLYFQYLREANLTRGLKGLLAKATLHYLRLWDYASAGRVDVFVANSHNVARRIRKVYRRESEVIYPPVDVARFTPGGRREDYYVTVSRLVPYKKIDLMVSAFSQMGLPLVVIGDGPEMPRLKELAGPTVQLLGFADDKTVQDHLQRARAFIFAAEEDFGIAPVEAQAAGCPVIAYGRGGACETVIAGETGLFFPEQTPESLAGAVQAFEEARGRFDTGTIRRNAERFSRERFQKEFADLVERSWSDFRGACRLP